MPGKYNKENGPDGGFKMQPSSASSMKKKVGMQGSGGPKGGADVDYANNPRGIAPKKMGGGLGSLQRDPVEPKVGK